MAGSIKWFRYTDDFGSIYALEADESNTEAINGANDYTGTPILTDALPRNVQPRFAVYSNSEGTRNIKVPVLNPTAYNQLVLTTPTITDPIAGTGNLTLQRLRPEKRRLPIPNDTGLDDGDAT